MGILNDIKRLFWAKKAIAKNTANKAADAAKEKGEELATFAKEEANELAEKAKETAQEWGAKAEDLFDDVGDKIQSTGKIASEKAKQFAEEVEQKFTPQESFEPTKTENDDVMDEIFKERNAQQTSPFESTKEPTDTSSSSLEDSYKQAKAYADDLSGKALEKGGDLYNKLSGKATEIGEQIEKNENLKKAGKMAEEVGDKVLDAGEVFMEKFGELSESVGEKVIDKGGKAMEKASEMAEDLGARIIKAKNDLIEKAEAEAAKSGESFDDTVSSAKDLEEKLKDKISGKVDFEKDFAKDPIDVDDSELDKHESFFEKAQRYADGNYGSKGKNKPEGTLNIQDNPEYEPKKKSGHTKGFEDLDGDGNDIIDDAIVED